MNREILYVPKVNILTTKECNATMFGITTSKPELKQQYAAKLYFLTGKLKVNCVLCQLEKLVTCLTK